MSLIISSRIQNRAPDSIEYATDLKVAVRANGEERTSFIDLAGNIYPAEIPAAVNAPTFVGLTVAANGLTPVGFYGYRYVFAATTRFGFLDGGKAIGGSIAPRGNPSPSLIVNMNVNLNYVNLTLPTNSRKDITEMWIFRTTNYATSADAQLAADAGLCFYVGKATNVPGGAAVAFQDTQPNLSLTQIEFDNFPAPTFKYVRYIPPYFWGIGNDEFVVPITWAGKILTISDSKYQWFDGRNGQFATVSGITTGGIDGRGLFLFKAGDEFGFNQQINAVLTKDGITPETLAPTSGTGFITIFGIGSVLYRSKYKNPLAWGYTQVIGASRLPQIFAVNVAAGNATALIGLPDDQQLKVDFKNPSACYTYNLRLAGAVEFSSTRRLISNYSVGSHASQFIATGEGNKKTVWGWDADTFAILQSDGASQVPISDPIFKTLRTAVRDPFRIQFAHGICDDENQLNCLWIPKVGQANYEAGYPATSQLLYKQTALTDLCIFQHYPSGKWGYNFEGDITAAAKIRNLNINKLQVVGGTDTGLLLRINDNTSLQNILYYGPYNNVSIDKTLGYPNLMTLPAGTFIGIDTTTLQGVWGVFYALDGTIIYGRILVIEEDTVFFDMFMYPGSDTIALQIITNTPVDPTICKFAIGAIPKITNKTIEFGKPAVLKKIEEAYYKGVNLQFMLTTFNNSQAFRQSTSFAELTPFAPSNIWRLEKPALPPDYKIDIRLFEASNQGIRFKGMGLKMT